jgi:hypothetical protein
MASTYALSIAVDDPIARAWTGVVVDEVLTTQPLKSTSW